MNIVFAYICLDTHRVFRVKPALVTFAPARVPETLVLKVTDEELKQFTNTAWTWGRGFYSDKHVLTPEASKKLEILNDRCMALELLYFNVAVWRQNFEAHIPFAENAEEILIQEAKSQIETKDQGHFPLLSQYAKAWDLELEMAAQLVLLKGEEKRACIVRTELFKIEWEARLLKSADPLQELAHLKEAYPIFER